MRGVLFTDAFAELHLRTMYLLPVIGNGYAQLLTDRFSVAFFQIFHFNGGAPMVRQQVQTMGQIPVHGLGIIGFVHVVLGGSMFRYPATIIIKPIINL